MDARTQVHEYGGGEYLAVPGEHATTTIFFSSFKDQQIWVQELPAPPAPPSPPRALTPAGQGLRFADAVWDRTHRRVICVCEKHSQEAGGAQQVNRVLGFGGALADITKTLRI